jgi:hypothetical protein
LAFFRKAPTDRDFLKAEAHVERFREALKQCQKGDERKAQLRRDLDYWCAIVALGRK